MKLCHGDTYNAYIALNIAAKKDIIKYHYENYTGAYICYMDYGLFAIYGYFLKRDKSFIYFALDKFS